MSSGGASSRSADRLPGAPHGSPTTATSIATSHAPSLMALSVRAGIRRVHRSHAPSTRSAAAAGHASVPAVNHGTAPKACSYGAASSGPIEARMRSRLKEEGAWGTWGILSDW